MVLGIQIAKFQYQLRAIFANLMLTQVICYIAVHLWHWDEALVQLCRLLALPGKKKRFGLCCGLSNGLRFGADLTRFRNAFP